MKRIIMLLACLMLAGSMCAQVVREGKTFKTEKSSTSKQDTDTGYLWQDKSGETYPIYMSSKGSLYIIRTSKKTGKTYRQYLDKEVQQEIKKQLSL